VERGREGWMDGERERAEVWRERRGEVKGIEGKRQGARRRGKGKGKGKNEGKGRGIG
jgi:hypothetical protein